MSSMAEVGSVRLLILSLLLAFIADIAYAQTPYPASAPPSSAWGGYTLAPQVPYQPTLDAPAVFGPPDANQPWQGYPAPAVQAPIGSAPPGTQPDAVYLDGPTPPQAHELAPDIPLYPGKTEPTLRESLTPPGARNGFFQEVIFDADFLPSFGSDNLGWTDLRAEVVTALPFFTRENPIIISPSYESRFLDRPVGFDLPARLNDV